MNQATLHRGKAALKRTCSVQSDMDRTAAPAGMEIPGPGIKGIAVLDESRHYGALQQKEFEAHFCLAQLTALKSSILHMGWKRDIKNLLHLVHECLLVHL